MVSLGAIGLSLTFSILRFANFGHGELLAWGAYLAFTALAMCTAVLSAMGAAAPIAPFSFGWPLLAAMAISALLTVLLVLALDGLLFRRLRKQRAITLVIASFGSALALRNLLLFFYGGIPQYYSQELQIAIALLPRSVWGGMRITPDQLFVLGLTAGDGDRAAPVPAAQHARPRDACHLAEPAARACHGHRPRARAARRVDHRRRARRGGRRVCGTDRATAPDAGAGPVCCRCLPPSSWVASDRSGARCSVA